MEKQGVLEELEAGVRGQKRYLARRLMDAIAGDSG
jgi:hypothetical protein